MPLSSAVSGAQFSLASHFVSMLTLHLESLEFCPLLSISMQLLSSDLYIIVYLLDFRLFIVQSTFHIARS